MPDSQFQGRIGRTVSESVPWWPPEATPPAGAPHVVLIVFDDVGFGHFGCYGSTLATPRVDALADAGVRFTNFHTTALCSPTRASLLTGRNHHSIGMRSISNFNTGFPNMRGAIPRDTPTLAEILRDQGYGTYMVGKWHLAPMEESGPAGPFRNWPLARGFDRFYGFLQGETDQFRPELVKDNHYIEPPAGAEDGYHLTEDLVDQAILLAREHISAAPERPMFTYLALGAGHAPHQAPEEYRRRWHGHFDEGWDVMRERWFARQKELGIVPPDTELPPRNPGVRAWADLSENERRFAARLQEVFAAFMEHADYHVGRYIDALAEIGCLDNTLLIVMSDNGASQEGGPTGMSDHVRWFNGIPENVDAQMARLDLLGGPDSYTNYPWGWAMVGNTPLKRYKQNTHAGGVRDPLIVHWPAQIKETGGLRPQFHHVVDVAPTVMELLGMAPPREVNGRPAPLMHGVSMAYAIVEGAARQPTRKRTQYFEMFGHRAIWHEGWKAVCYHESGADYDTEAWELYHADDDASEARDLAAAEPERLRELVQLWWSEAERYDVLPLDDRGLGELVKSARFRGGARQREHYELFPPISRYSVDVAPPTGGRSFCVRAEIKLPPGAEHGALLARGGPNGGFIWYVRARRMVFHYNHFHHHTRVESEVELPAHPCVVRLQMRREGKAGVATLWIDDEVVATMHVPEIARVPSMLGMDVGRSLAPICPDYAAPFRFEGSIRRVVIEIEARRTDIEREKAVAERVTQGMQ